MGLAQFIPELSIFELPSQRFAQSVPATTLSAVYKASKEAAAKRNKLELVAET